MQPIKITHLIFCVLVMASLLAACTPASTPQPRMTDPRPATAVPPTATPAPTDTPKATPTSTSGLSPDEFMARQDPIAWLGWAADGRTLAVSASSGLYLLDAQDGSSPRLLDKSEFIFPETLDPQGKYLLAGNHVWDLASGKLLYRLSSTNINSAAFSPDEKTLALGENNSITLWDATTGKFQKSIGIGLGPGTVFFGLAFDAGGNRLYADYADGKVRSLDLVSGKSTDLFSLPGRNCCNAIGPGGLRMLVDFSDHGAGHKELWDVQSGKMLINAEHCDNDVNFSAFSADGRYFSTGPCGLDARIWDIETLKLLHSFPSTTAPGSIHPEWRAGAFSPDSSQIALANDVGEVLIWDLTNYQLVKTLALPHQ